MEEQTSMNSLISSIRRNSGHFPTLTQQVQHELGDITTGNGDMLDGTADDITFRAGNDVRDTIARVNDGAGKCAIGDTVG